VGEITAATAMLGRLGQLGIRYLFANSGTDFAPIIEAYEQASPELLQQFPKPLTIPHETVAVAMAHGAYLVSGEPQAVMVHVNVGLANSLMGLMNAQSDNIPLIMLAGRTPITEYQREGSRMTPIQYGQEMSDQGQVVRQVVKWDYELRYGEQIVDAIDRAWVIAQSEPKGPVFLSLPREPLAEAITGGRDLQYPLPVARVETGLDAGVLDTLLDRLSCAEFPLVIAQRNSVDGALGAAIENFCISQGIGVIEPFAKSNLMSNSMEFHLGYQVGELLSKSDFILVVESPVPWIQRFTSPRDVAFIVHVGQDPNFANLPMRSFPSSLCISADPVRVLTRIAEQAVCDSELLKQRWENLRHLKGRQLESKQQTITRFNQKASIAPAFVSSVLGEFLDDSTLLFSELGPPPGFAKISSGNQWFTPPYSGGLGWGVPAAMGAKLSRPTARVIACVGDGSYIFANPVACHQVMTALSIPVLTVIMDNSSWNATRRAVHNMYPEGAAAQKDTPVLTSLAPSPDFVQVAASSGGWARRVERPDELLETLRIASKKCFEEGIPATVVIKVEKTDGF
jgi:acetolactate synthase-1/2/3 large subunit